MTHFPPSTLEDHLGYWLRCLSNYVHHRFEARLAEHGVSVAQWVVLRTLYDKDSVMLNEAAQMVGVDKSSLSRMVERLVQKELLIRVISEGDRRSVLLTLSPTGKALVPVLAQLADENDQKFFQSLSEEDQQHLMHTITHLLKANGWNASTSGEDRMT